MSGHGPGDFIFGADPIRGGSGAEAAIDTHVYSLSWRWKNIDFCKGFSFKKIKFGYRFYFGFGLDIDFYLDWMLFGAQKCSSVNFSDVRSPKVL